MNDTLGHDAGDELITQFAKRLSLCCREIDTVARLGGDEFVILLSEIENFSDATQLANRIIEETNRPLFLKGHEISPETSIGIANNATEYSCANDILRNADFALYKAKEKKGSAYELFDKKMKSQIVTQFHLEEGLKGAIKFDEMVLHYQPTFCLKTQKIVGFEALMRWNHPRFGYIPPDNFIPLAEESDSIHTLGHWALEVACQQLSNWRKMWSEAQEWFIAVNVSARQLAHKQFINQVKETIHRFELPPEKLHLEITETSLVDNLDQCEILLTAIKELGVHLAIDDFGTGYSSLATLHQLPFDTLKVDRNFVATLSKDKKSFKTLRVIQILAKELGMHTIAEGVETNNEQKLLCQAGYDFAQGFLFSEALESSKIETLISSSLQKKNAV